MTRGPLCFAIGASRVVWSVGFWKARVVARTFSLLRVYSEWPKIIRFGHRLLENWGRVCLLFANLSICSRLRMLASEYGILDRAGRSRAVFRNIVCKVFSLSRRGFITCSF